MYMCLFIAPGNIPVLLIKDTIRDSDDEKTFKDAYEYCRQAQARIPEQDGQEGG
jgi:hypothetical protein